MHLKTLLNRVHPVKGFVYEKDELVGDAGEPNGVRMEARVRARRGSRGSCSGCGRRGPTYDTQAARRFDFVPLWGIAVALVYAPRRIECPTCGVKVERMPWCAPGGKSPMTLALTVFLATWARWLSWKQVAEVFWVSWDSVYRAVESVVNYGLARRDFIPLGASIS